MYINVNINQERLIALAQFQPHSTHQSELEHLGEPSVHVLCVWLVQPLVWDVVHGLSEIVHDLLRGPSLALGRGGKGKGEGKGGEGGGEGKGKGEGGEGRGKREGSRTFLQLLQVMQWSHISPYLLRDEQPTEGCHKTEGPDGDQDVGGSEEVLLDDGQRQ